MTTYIYGDIEVKLTGREAKKPGTPSKRLKASDDLMVEITPVDTAADWKRWIKMIDLFEVFEEPNVNIH